LGMIRIYIIEDSIAHLELLKMKVEMLDYEVVGYSQTTNNALQDIQEKKPDVALVDINLTRDRDGITLAHEIQEFTNTKVIFITSQSQSEVISDAITAKPSGYLIKPVDPEELKANIELAAYKKQEKQEVPPDPKEYITVRTGEKLQLVYFKDVTYAHVDVKNYVTLIDKENKQFAVRDSLKNVVDNILPPGFIRTHKSFAINMDYVAFIDEKEQSVFLKTSDSIPIGKSFRKHVYEKMNIRT